MRMPICAHTCRRYWNRALSSLRCLKITDLATVNTRDFVFWMIVRLFIPGPSMSPVSVRADDPHLSQPYTFLGLPTKANKVNPPEHL